MKLTLPSIHINRSAMFYLGLFAALFFLVMAVQPAMASEGTGGSLPL